MAESAVFEYYECSGLVVASTIPLSAPRSLISDPAQADVVLVMGDEVTPPFERPSADLVAELVVADYLCYTICRTPEGYVARLPWIADFVIDADLRHVVCHRVAGGRDGVISVIFPGTITAFLLAMSGRCVLHGSAVDISGKAVAFVGVSGQGKSTMAAIFCAAGATLVTDDVLPLEFEENGELPGSVFCLRSGHEIRLREKAVSLAQHFSRDAVRVTPDERHAVTPEASALAHVPLAGIILPRPDRDHLTVTAKQLGAGEASFALGRYERIEGWRAGAHLRQQFIDVGRIVASVPVFEVSVPWGPPFDEDLAQRVLDACGLDTTMSDADAHSANRLVR
jgi:hypothetical protein